MVSGAASNASASTPSGTGSGSGSKGGAVRHFAINEIDVEGNTVLDEASIDRAIEPYLGPDKTLDDINAARGALEKAYASAGYQTVYVVLPPQTVRGGVVRLKAVEAKIGTVAVKGAAYTTPSRIEAALSSLKPGTVPNLKSLNGELIALNSQSNDRQVTPAMKPGVAPDTIDVNLNVDDKLPLHGGLELNNKYSRDTSALRLQANIEYDDLWGLGHSLSALYSVAPQNRDDGEVYSLSYSAPVPGTDLKLSLTGLRSNSNVTTLGSTDVLGRGTSAILGLTAPLGSLGGYFHYLQASVAYKHFTDTVELAGQSNSAPITYYPLSLTYVGTWHGPSDQLSLNGSLTASFRGLGSSTNAYDYTRYRADANFLYARGALSYLHNFPYGLDLYGEVEGQMANGPLVSNEQFSIGGDGSVRGYLQSEGLGDDGLRTSVELRSPNLGLYLGSKLSGAVDELRLVGFFDGAKAWLHDPLPQQQDYARMRSVGAGLTIKLFGHLNGSLYWADPLDTTTGPNLSGATRAGQSRVQFRVWSQF